MTILYKAFIALAASVAYTSFASAQTAPSEHMDFVWKQTETTKDVKIFFTNPPECDAMTEAAIQRWGSNISALNLRYYGLTADGIDSPSVVIRVVDRSLMTYGYSTGEAHRNKSTRTYPNTYIDGKRIPRYADADVLIDSDHFKDRLHCSSPSTVNYGRTSFGFVVGHELGHVIGLDHLPDSGECYMTRNYPGGTVMPAKPCGTELRNVTQLYQANP